MSKTIQMKTTVINDGVKTQENGYPITTPDRVVDGDGVSVETKLSGKINEPASEGTNGQVLTTDGNGGRAWTTVQGGGTSVPTITIDESQIISPDPVVIQLTDAQYTTLLNNTVIDFDTTEFSDDPILRLSKYDDNNTDVQFSIVHGSYVSNDEVFCETLTVTKSTKQGEISSFRIEALPSQSGHSGKYLKTNGTSASWATVSGGYIAQASEPSESDRDKLWIDTDDTSGGSGGGGTWGSITGDIGDQTDLATVVSSLINQWDEQWENGTYNGTTGGGKITASGKIRNINLIAIKPNTKYYLSFVSTGITAFYYNSNKSFLSYAGILGNSEFTTPANAYYMSFATNGSSITTYSNNLSINYPSTYTGYYPAKLSKVDMPFGDLLWTNASPTSEFAAQDIALDLSAYPTIYIIFRIIPDTNDSSFVFAKTTGYYYYCLNFLNDGINRYRPFYATSSGVHFVDGRKNETYGTRYTTDNTLMVPWYIYGVK